MRVCYCFFLVHEQCSHANINFSLSLSLSLTHSLSLSPSLSFSLPLPLSLPLLLPPPTCRVGRRKKRYHVQLGHRKIFRRFRALCCCFGAGGNQSSALAMQDAAKAFHTLFSDLDLVPSDLLAGLFLLKRDQRQKKESCKCPVCTRVCNITLLISLFHFVPFSFLLLSLYPSICSISPTLFHAYPS